ncbi:dihydropteroate synthase [Salmonella enterica subsp. enterica]|uniref:Dihydropteroate synthase n=1 Tax=Salmonella enterica I TaxID=59201 RepID=A0A379WLZ1_SALET|nr:dihydropteroate synthase [Salmonella enterica subsp. enterica]
MSRKTMVGQLLNVGPSDRLNGSLACAVIAAMQGAQIIRVHDVQRNRRGDAGGRSHSVCKGKQTL